MLGMRIIAYTLALILTAGTAVPASAQTNRARKPVSEAQVVKLIPVLRTLAAQVRQSRLPVGTERRLDEARAARIALLEDIKSRKVDPREWIEAHSVQAVLPPLAEYSSIVSRLATELSLRPCAVFGFGIEASEIGQAKLRGDREEERRLVERGIDRSDAQLRVDAVIAGVRRFYLDRRFSGFDRESPFAWSVISPDSLFTVTLMEANPYHAWGSTGLPSGPVLEITWNEDSDDLPETGESLPSLLKRLGMGDREFLDLLTALVVARHDAHNPSRLSIETNYQPESEEDRQVFEEFSTLVKVRTENVALYRRYNRMLDPLLDAFDEE